VRVRRKVDAELKKAVRARRKAEAKFDDVCLALQQHAQSSPPPIRQSYLEQRVVEQVNQLRPQWQVRVSEDRFEAYSSSISDQLEFAFATQSVASILWSCGKSQPSCYEVDMREPDSGLLEQVNPRTGSRRVVRREMVPIEQSQDEEQSQRPPPLFSERYPNCWLGSADIDRVQLPPDGAVGRRVLDFMLSSLVECSAASMDGLEIKRIERVENHLLWENYKRYRQNVEKRMDSLGDRRPEPLSQRAAVAAILDAAAAVDACVDDETDDEDRDVLPAELYSRVLCTETSEIWLFHGTKPSLVDTVTTNGLDPRRSNMSGLYGAGTYFADSASKSHQYSKVVDEDGCRCMLLCRVTMGVPFMTDRKHQNERLPPENPATPGRAHDSIFAEAGVAHGMSGSGSQKHNEYVVFHPDASYPEYIIYYTVSTPASCDHGRWGQAYPPPRTAVPLDVQTYLNRVGLGAWVSYFASHLPSMVKTVPLVRTISRVDLRRMASAANMRLDARTAGQVLDALKKPP